MKSGSTSEEAAILQHHVSRVAQNVDLLRPLISQPEEERSSGINVNVACGTLSEPDVVLNSTHWAFNRTALETLVEVYAVLLPESRKHHGVSRRLSSQRRESHSSVTS